MERKRRFKNVFKTVKLTDKQLEMCWHGMTVYLSNLQDRHECNMATRKEINRCESLAYKFAKTFNKLD